MRKMIWLCVVFVCTSLVAQESVKSSSRAQAIERGIAYLFERGQTAEGAFSPQTGIAVTGLVVTAILENQPNAVNDPRIQKAVKLIEKNVQDDGGIYTPDSRFRNYETCVAIMALKRAQGKGETHPAIAKAEKYIRAQQWDEGEGLESSDMKYGGAGYGNQSRPDMSNTSFFLDALQELGAGEDDEAIKKALVFVSRAQNLPSSGTLPNENDSSDKTYDGGFFYTPASGGQSPAGRGAEGGLRSYGSMTYAGLKSMIYAGVDEKDPRVQAALKYLRNNYTLDANPGMGQAGLYYYYHTFSKSMGAMGKATFTDAQGTEHVWRHELVETLISKQKPDGSWVNTVSDRWMETDPNLVTAYALLALARTGE